MSAIGPVFNLERCESLKTAWAYLVAALALNAPVVAAIAEEPLFSSARELEVPAGPGAREPVLSAMPDGRVLLSWTEPAGKGFAVRVSMGNADGWSEPRTVVESSDLFVNWADFPSAIALLGGTLAAHWLNVSGSSSYAYDVNISLSTDEGRSWGPAIVPHAAGTERQYGFASLLALDGERLLAVWLDGRNYDPSGGFASGEAGTDAMQLRAAVVGADGRLSEDTLLDSRTCTCCQTSATRTDSGKILVVYRDRSEVEIRDIAIVRLVDGVWSKPAAVSLDGWKIEGCPVNGPAVDSSAAQVAVAWFTAADDVPKVKVAFSADDGATFGPAVGIDQGSPTGRVDVLQLEDGSALVSWLEQTGFGEALYLCRVVATQGCREPSVLAVGRQGRTNGFPRMARVGDAVYIAWTTPGDSPGVSPDDDVTIRVVLANLGDHP